MTKRLYNSSLCHAVKLGGSHLQGKKRFISRCSFLLRLSSSGGPLCRGFRAATGTLENEKHLSHLHSGSESSPPGCRSKDHKLSHLSHLLKSYIFLWRKN